MCFKKCEDVLCKQNSLSKFLTFVPLSTFQRCLTIKHTVLMIDIFRIFTAYSDIKNQFKPQLKKRKINKTETDTENGNRNLFSQIKNFNIPIIWKTLILNSVKNF